MFLTQTKYVLDLLQRTNMLGAKPIGSPISTHDTLSSSKGDLLQDRTYYRSIVGALQYLTLTLTQPDIIYVVNQVCQFMHAPTRSLLTVVKRILRFFKGSLELGLYLKPGPLQLIAYNDADWAGNPIDRRSTSGFCIYFGHSPVSWCSKKQPTVARSSTEFEYRCLAQKTVEFFWLCMLLRDLCIYLPVMPLIWCDNI